jgi:hypothetical protein
LVTNQSIKQQMNSLEGSIMHITMSGDYTCDIIRINPHSTFQNQLYLLHEKSTGDNYWAMPYSNLLKIIGQIIFENNISKLRFSSTSIFKNKECIKMNYILYAPSVKFYIIPSRYYFENERKKWNDFCECIEGNYDKVQINKIINVFGLKQHIANYL